MRGGRIIFRSLCGLHITDFRHNSPNSASAAAVADNKVDVRVRRAARELASAEFRHSAPLLITSQRAAINQRDRRAIPQRAPPSTGSRIDYHCGRSAGECNTRAHHRSSWNPASRPAASAETRWSLDVSIRFIVGLVTGHSW